MSKLYARNPETHRWFCVGSWTQAPRDSYLKNGWSTLRGK